MLLVLIMTIWINTIGSVFMQLSGTFADSHQFMVNPEVVKELVRKSKLSINIGYLIKSV